MSMTLETNIRKEHLYSLHTKMMHVDSWRDYLLARMLMWNSIIEVISNHFQSHSPISNHFSKARLSADGNLMCVQLSVYRYCVVGPGDNTSVLKWFMRSWQLNEWWRVPSSHYHTKTLFIHMYSICRSAKFPCKSQSCKIRLLYIYDSGTDFLTDISE
jgi:hypothetical protein